MHQHLPGPISYKGPTDLYHTSNSLHFWMPGTLITMGKSPNFFFAPKERNESSLSSQWSLKTLGEPRPGFPNFNTISVVSIIGGFFTSVALAVGHHLFLYYIHGRNIDDYSQSWVKNASNGFASVFAICLAFSVHCALTQSKWRIVGQSAISIQSLDSLFAMPAPLSLLAAVFHPRRPLILPILASIFIQALILVGILAPNALSVSASDLITANLTVPTLDLSSAPITSIDMGLGPSYTNMSSSWEQLTNTIMLNPPAVNWDMPTGCGAACSFGIQYQAPALKCREIGVDEYKLHPGWITEAPHQWVYEANSSLYPSPVIPSGEWDIDAKYDLSVQYAGVTKDHQMESWPGSGVYCQFRNATYSASLNFTSSTKSIKTTIISYGDILGGTHDCVWRSSPGPCWNRGVNTRAMCDTFASAIQGRIGYDVSFTPGSSPTVGFVGMVGNMALIQTMFNYQSFFGPPFGEFDIKVPGLGTALVDTFSNLTLGLIPHRNDTVVVAATIWDGTNMWTYTDWTLWAVYAPALLFAIPFLINGLLSIRMNGMAIEDGFSTFLLTTRNHDLDEMCQKARTFEELETQQLLYHKTGKFIVSSSSELNNVSSPITTVFVRDI